MRKHKTVEVMRFLAAGVTIGAENLKKDYLAEAFSWSATCLTLGRQRKAL